MPNEKYKWSDSTAMRFAEFRRSGDLAWDYILRPSLVKRLEAAKGKRVIDIGCGLGCITREISRFASETIGIDSSEKMVQLATHANDGNDWLSYMKGDIYGLEDLGLGVSDMIWCINLLVDIEFLDDAVRSVASCLCRGGHLLVAIEHPFHTAKTSRAKDALFRRSATGMEYFERFPFVSNFLGRDFPVVGWHRPLGDYIDIFLRNGLTIVDYEEPKPVSPIAQLAAFCCTPLFAVFLLRNDGILRINTL